MKDMMTKFKMLLVLIVLGYLGFFGWSSLTKKNEVSFFSTSKRGGEHVSPPAKGGDEQSTFDQMRQEINGIKGKIFVNLGTPENRIEPELKNLWDGARSEFKAGTLSENEAKILSERIRKLLELARERDLYEQRLLKSQTMDLSPFRNGKSNEEKIHFIENEVYRQWDAWVEKNQCAAF